MNSAWTCVAPDQADLAELPVTDGSRGEFVPVSVLEAVRLEHREEVAVLSMRLAAYRAALEDAGLECPDDGSRDWLSLYRACSLMVKRASEFASETLGTSKELLQDWSA